MQENRFCQSCLLPMSYPSLIGTNSDGSLNIKFCGICYQNGNFTSPETTLQEMTQKVKKEMEANQIPLNIIDLSINYLPKLARWKNAV